MMNILEHDIGYGTSGTPTNSCCTMNENVLLPDQVLVNKSISLLKILR